VRAAPADPAPPPAGRRAERSDPAPPPAGRRAERLALAAALALWLALALYGQRVHWLEEAGTAERDGYVSQAELLLSGSLPRDPYRPLLYPLLAAALAPLAGGAFPAARLISNLAAAALAWLAWAYGRRLAGAAAGAWAMALVAVNPNLWIIGQHVSTDMPFGALAAAALLAGLCYLQAPRPATALGAGLALGLAAFTRSNALFLLPALLAAWWLAPPAAPAQPAAPAPAGSLVAPATPGTARRQLAGTSGAPGRRRRRLGHLALAAAGAVLVLAPHWALRQAQFGSPFYDENWKNLAWKLYGYPDWSYLERVPFRSAAELLAHDPWAVLRGGAAELWRFVTAGAAQLFGTWVHVLMVGAGAAWALIDRGTRRVAAWLLFALGSFTVATAFAFFTWGRLLLLLLPGAAVLAFAPWAAATGPGWRWRRVLAGVGAAAVLLLAVKTFAFRLPAFAARHPYVEVELLRGLDRRLPPGEALGGSSPFLGRYLRHRYVALPDAFGEEIAQPGLYYAKIRRQLQGAGVAYLVIGPVDLRARPRALLGPDAPVPWLAPAGGQQGVVVWQVRELPRRPAGSS
jgi:Dolichyl-phosphate-mannose-protein mannosyltransferase